MRGAVKWNIEIILNFLGQAPRLRWGSLVGTS